MKNISRYTTDDMDLLNKTIKSKAPEIREVLESLQPQVLSCYNTYEKNANSLERLTPIKVTPLERQYLNHCYTSNTKPVLQLKKDLFEYLGYNRAICPYCQISEPVTLDHFLPESQFPEFSILSANLIPVCPVCNGTKLAQYSANGQRLFFNPYFDDIANNRFLFAILTPGPSSVTVAYRIERPAGLDNYIFRILQNHFVMLKLADRYMRQASSKLFGIIEIINRHKRLGEDEITSILKQKADECTVINGINHWETALYFALSELDLSFLLASEA